MYRLCLLFFMVMAFLGCADVPDDLRNGINCSLSGGNVKIGNQVWMAKNLNDNVSGSKCYNNEESNCAIYGRLYDWETAKKACPSGWHLPSDAEWDALVTAVGGDSKAGTKLKAKSGWNNNGNGTDNCGFSALPGGIYNSSNGNFVEVGILGRWWSATEDDASYAYTWSMGYTIDHVYSISFGKSGFHSVRCIQDNSEVSYSCSSSKASSSSSVSLSSSSIAPSSSSIAISSSSSSIAPSSSSSAVLSSSSVEQASSDGCKKSSAQKSDFSCKWDKEGEVLPGQTLKPVAEGSTTSCTVQWNFKDSPLAIKCYKTTSDGFKADDNYRYILFAELTCGSDKYVHACSPTDGVICRQD